MALVDKCKERYSNSDRNFVMKKIHSFRCAFRRELKKIISSLKSGSATDEVYVLNLWYYDILSFIADSEMPRDAKSNVGADHLEDASELEVSEGENQQSTEEATSDIHEEILYSPIQSPDPEPSRPGSSHSSSSAKRSRYPQTPTFGRSKGKNAKKDVLLHLASESMKKYCSAETPGASFNSLSDVDIAGVKYAPDLSSLDPMQRSFVKKIVSDAIFYARLGKLTEYSTVQHYNSYFGRPASYNPNYSQQSGPNNDFIPVHSLPTFPNIARPSKTANVQPQAEDVIIADISQYLRFPAEQQ